VASALVRSGSWRFAWLSKLAGSSRLKAMARLLARPPENGSGRNQLLKSSIMAFAV
jgi:hypothetical protein